MPDSNHLLKPKILKFNHAPYLLRLNLALSRTLNPHCAINLNQKFKSTKKLFLANLKNLFLLFSLSVELTTIPLNPCRFPDSQPVLYIKSCSKSDKNINPFERLQNCFSTNLQKGPTEFCPFFNFGFSQILNP